MIRTLVILSSILSLASAECPNGCSSHGKCSAYDMCLCYRNWMSNDCSERVCQFGLAHVDTPKGDLDASSGVLSDPSVLVAINSEVYPYGTTEQFPSMKDSDGNALSDTAHYYMECSNKGICDRSAGVCECFPGYEGSACQRASCPVKNGATCSGHGTCETIRQIASRDHGNIYELWDKHSTMGCVCDAGYSGPDCSSRECKYGADPLYFDDNSNIRYSNWTVVIAADNAVSHPTLSGTYSIRFFDHFGEDWETAPISASATCSDIITALENIPNDVIPDGSVRCRLFNRHESDFNMPFWDNSTTGMYVFTKYTIMFPLNPGYLREIQLNPYLDGQRPTLWTSETTSSLQLFVYANGFSGEDKDLVPDECENVLVSFAPTSGLGTITTAYTLSFTDSAVQGPLLKRCLGDSNNDLSFSGQDNEVYNWDHGTDQNPHLVKFIEATDKIQSRICHSIGDYAYVDPSHGNNWCFETAPAGFYAPVIYHSGSSKFIVFSRAGADYSSSTLFRVFTTKGYLNRVSNEAEIFTASSDWTDYHSNVLYSYNRGSTFNTAVLGAAPHSTVPYRAQNAWSGFVDCETASSRNILYEDCLQKGDYVFFFSTELTNLNYNSLPKYHNIYEVEKIYKALPDSDTANDDVELTDRNRIVLDKHVNFKFALSSSSSGTALANDVRLRAYKFYPPSNAITYVEQCSGRGICNSDEGLCDCFPGYTNDDCSVQNSAAA